MDDAKKYLSDRLLSEEVPVTYRLLSRVLNIRVNVAKQKLYEFHQSQNASKADSIHATYLIYGSKTEHKQPETGDTDMDNSVPEPEPLSDYAPTKTVTIVAEENLKDALAEYEEVTSFHIYSLAPFPQRDLALLSDVSKSLSEYRKIEDAAKTLDTYGIIANPQARRKDRKGRPPVPTPAPTASAPKNVKQEAPPTLSKPSQPEKVKQEVKEVSSAEATPSSSAGKKPPATLKRGASGGIMQSFAKAAAKPPKPKPEPKPKEEDTSMALSDDGEADDEDLPTSKSIDLEALKRTRKQREEELMRMMEDADDDIKEAKKEDEQSDEEMEEPSEAEPEPEPEPEQQPKEEKEPTEVISNSGDGRRRGKRRVMKKKRILDDQGYMVTIQEAAWESFSEDEAPPPAATKPTPASTPAASSTQKSKKAAAPKSGSQGSIMSFFAKK
ncbi:DNA polymerase subunit cdc27 domain-containing protein [Trichoderma breve]|uniref:DNA polymerase delta subunit 3 n=1 Tax=Trichoderma breve TaxID=2034170 RepID=A0A9W9BCT2_9HYPO|nr:DNA polymerase subunit cdc27 domain-containing protein [Trichoderma breve]KAJ4857491.1 DNA polymerase subunit cdc27 domain-containing protein [Trichoderma breve]